MLNVQKNAKKRDMHLCVISLRISFPLALELFYQRISSSSKGILHKILAVCYCVICLSNHHSALCRIYIRYFEYMFQFVLNYDMLSVLPPLDR